VMLGLESCLGWLRRRWLMPPRLGLHQGRVGHGAREMGAALLLLVPISLLVGWSLGVEPLALLHWQPLPGLGAGHWQSALDLPWLRLVGGTIQLTLLAAGLAVGLPPLQLLLATPAPWARGLVRFSWALGRLWPPPLTALLLLLLLKPGLITAALALGFHNMGILGRLLLESAEDHNPAVEQGLRASGSGPRLALLYGLFSDLARPYLAYGAYRADVMLRETVVVGMVAATGLGTQLLESLAAFAWDQLLALVAVYALLTLLGEAWSDRLRRRWLPG